MSAFGNLFSMESETYTSVQNYADSFNVADSNDVATSSNSTLSGVLNTTVSLGDTGGPMMILPWIAGAAIVVFLFWILGKG